jgi:hypothetical protein
MVSLRQEWFQGTVGAAELECVAVMVAKAVEGVAMAAVAEGLVVEGARMSAGCWRAVNVVTPDCCLVLAVGSSGGQSAYAGFRA